MPHSGPVIIVEDDEDDRNFIRDAFLELEIHNELKFFKEGGEFLQYLRSTPQKPFIIITDINLPGLTGLQLREEIQKDALLKKKCIPFFFMSTSDGKPIIDKVYELQVQGYFQKESNYPAMKQQIRVIIDYWKNCTHPNSV